MFHSRLSAEEDPSIPSNYRSLNLSLRANKMNRPNWAAANETNPVLHSVSSKKREKPNTAIALPLDPSALAVPSIEMDSCNPPKLPVSDMNQPNQVAGVE